MRFRVSDMAWVPLEEFPANRLKRLRDRLTIQPKKTSNHQQSDPEPIELFRVQRHTLGIPRGFFWQEFKRSQRNHVIDDERSGGRDIKLSFKGKLRDDQPAALAVALEDRDSGSPGGIIQAKPGWGKTVASLGIWTAFHTTALVLVNKKFLLDQWAERIAQFVPDARVGIIQGDKLQYGQDFDISIAMLQTLVSRADDYPPEFWSSFGLIIPDEIHRVAAPTWAGLVPRFTGKYRLGLTATPRRKDRAQDVFFCHVGPIIFRSKVKTVTPKVRRVFTGFRFDRSNIDSSQVSRETQIRHLCKSPKRNGLITSELSKAVARGRKVIVLSERRKHLEILREKFVKASPVGPEGKEIVSDFYIGGRDRDDLEKAEKADVIFCTYQMVQEALDIPQLDTLMLVTPSSDVEQAVGRIMREWPDKKPPIVTDFIDENVTRFVRAWNSRRRFYVKEGMFDGGKI